MDALGTDDGAPGSACRPSAASSSVARGAAPTSTAPSSPTPTCSTRSARSPPSRRRGVLRSVDYRNLGSEELGSIYESLLELHPESTPTPATFALATAAGNERKTTGSYYTPTSLISVLLDSALDPVLDEAAAQDRRTRSGRSST